MKSDRPRSWFSVRQWEWLKLDDLSLTEFCKEIEFLVWYYRDDPIITQWRGELTDKELFCENLRWLLSTQKKKK